MRTVILYRDSLFLPEERAAAEKYFTCTNSRMDIRAGDLVIPRYSALPFYEEQERDILKAGAVMLNTFKQHCYIAGMRGWVEDLGELTPQTWYSAEDLPEEGPFIVKGQTNSFKHRWSDTMYAPTKRDAIEIKYKLSLDSLIGQQDIFFRRYVPLVTYMQGFYDLPITKEFRFFVLDGKILCGAYYWSSHTQDLLDAGIKIPSADEVPKAFLETCLDKIGTSARGYALDVAEKQAGGWMVVELNDLQQSGLSDNDPDVFYKALSATLGGSHATLE
jgi:hypothetical protein